MAVDYLSALNVGSGLNTTEIIDALVEAERAPKASEINSAKEKRTVEISSLGQIKQGFETFDTALAPVEEITGLSVASSGSAIDVKISDAKQFCANDCSCGCQIRYGWCDCHARDERGSRPH